jgi:thiamine pyrophosphate-dependent acetolactate synthase large subunit-like protein
MSFTQIWAAHSTDQRFRQLDLERRRDDGFGFPSGIGGAARLPHKQVIAIVGDGGFR